MWWRYTPGSSPRNLRLCKDTQNLSCRKLRLPLRTFRRFSGTQVSNRKGGQAALAATYGAFWDGRSRWRRCGEDGRSEDDQRGKELHPCCGCWVLVVEWVRTVLIEHRDDGARGWTRGMMALRMRVWNPIAKRVCEGELMRRRSKVERQVPFILKTPSHSLGSQDSAIQALATKLGQCLLATHNREATTQNLKEPLDLSAVAYLKCPLSATTYYGIAPKKNIIELGSGESPAASWHLPRVLFGRELALEPQAYVGLQAH